jgi:hypothetical protein
VKNVNPLLLQQIFEDGIYLLQQDLKVSVNSSVEETQTTPKAANSVMLYVLYEKMELPEELQIFLQNVQKALPVLVNKITVEILNTPFENLEVVPISEKFISFGAVKNHGLQLYHVYQKSHNQEFVLIDKIEEMNQNITLKKQLRDALQILFDKEIKK